MEKDEKERIAGEENTEEKACCEHVKTETELLQWYKRTVSDEVGRDAGW